MKTLALSLLFMAGMAFAQDAPPPQGSCGLCGIGPECALCHGTGYWDFGINQCVDCDTNLLWHDKSQTRLSPQMLQAARLQFKGKGLNKRGLEQALFQAALDFISPVKKVPAHQSMAYYNRAKCTLTLHANVWR